MEAIIIAVVAGVIFYFGLELFSTTEDIRTLQEDRIKQIEKAIGE